MNEKLKEILDQNYDLHEQIGFIKASNFVLNFTEIDYDTRFKIVEALEVLFKKNYKNESKDSVAVPVKR